MGHFHGRAIVECVKPELWEVQGEFFYVATNHDVIRVPQWYLTDCASVPRPLWWLYPPYDYPYDAPAMIHDRLYETHTVSRDGLLVIVDQAYCDALFREMLAARGASSFEQALMFRAVWMFGASAFASGPERGIARRTLAHARAVALERTV